MFNEIFIFIIDSYSLTSVFYPLSDSSMSIDSILNSDFSTLSHDEICQFIRKGEELAKKGNIALSNLSAGPDIADNTEPSDVSEVSASSTISAEKLLSEHKILELVRKQCNSLCKRSSPLGELRTEMDDPASISK